MKKNNTKNEIKELAQLLSKVMKHPLTPERIINQLGNEICDMSTEIDYDSPELIEMSLIAFTKKTAKREAK